MTAGVDAEWSLQTAPRKAGVRAEAAIGSTATSAASLQHDILEPQPRTRRRWVRSAALGASLSAGPVATMIAAAVQPGAQLDLRNTRRKL
jgi:hypothetical protein